jgi:hypothetical protein
MLSWTAGQAFRGVYPYPVHHPYDRYSMVDLDAVNAEEWPDFGGVRGCVCILEPGDLLFVPQFWCTAAWRLHILPPALSCLPAHAPQQSARHRNTGESLPNALCRFAHVHFLDQDNTDLTFYLHPGMLCIWYCRLWTRLL